MNSREDPSPESAASSDKWAKEADDALRYEWWKGFEEVPKFRFGFIGYLIGKLVGRRFEKEARPGDPRGPGD